jgi:hypothetical protein
VAFHRINNLRVVNIVISSTSAKRVDQSDRVWVDEANAVPKDIPCTSLYQQRPLPDSKVGYRLYTPHSFAFLKECVPVRLLQFLQRDPLLPL